MNTAKYEVVRLPQSTERELEKIALEEKMSKNALVRKAVTKYIETRKWKIQQIKIAGFAKKIGIKTDDDVERLVDEIRR
jgi:predicted transcriptional regulator